MARNVTFGMLIVIVNYRTASLVADCLRSLEPEIANLPGTRVVVVDGGSADGSAEQLEMCIRERGYGRWVELLALRENRGFAAGNNAGLRYALASGDRPAHVYLLNPDTVVLPGALTALTDFMREHPRAGILGSRCENPDGSPRQTAFRFHSILGELESEAGLGVVSRVLADAKIALPVSREPHRCDWVSGAAMLVRTEVFERVGLLDEEFFLYYEETDFALRAARAGFECWYVPASRVIHYCGQASGITGADAHKNRVPDYWYASRRRYFEKHHGRMYAATADAAWLAGSLTRRCRRALLQRPSQDPPKQLRDFLRWSALRWTTS
jgi:N-acetylglucosaminyl-diphospho-decaprenol L-rhamnosyltransferase